MVLLTVGLLLGLVFFPADAWLALNAVFFLLWRDVRNVTVCRYGWVFFSQRRLYFIDTDTLLLYSSLILFALKRKGCVCGKVPENYSVHMLIGLDRKSVV